MLLCSLFNSSYTYFNRHERQFHPNGNFDAPPIEQEITTGFEEDFMFNYHQAKLMFGLILMAFEDAVKEGDGQRLFEIYKLFLLLYKANGHTKYAYATLLYLVKICSIFSEYEANRLKWNRFYNNHGGKGKNIPLDLKKEHQNKQLKKMWRALGPNLNEKNAARLARTLDSVECILQSIDKDCKVIERKSHRAVPKKEEAVYQIVKDLTIKKVFTNTPGREGHPSFSNFRSNLLPCMDYRDLHRWMRDNISNWKSIYLANLDS
jgi:hypothetical protein